MRNRIHKHCNAINAKGGEVNNKFKHWFGKTNRSEAQFDHAPFCHYNSAATGWYTKDLKVAYKKSTSNDARKLKTSNFFLLTSFIHSHSKSDSFEK